MYVLPSSRTLAVWSASTPWLATLTSRTGTLGSSTRAGRTKRSVSYALGMRYYGRIACLPVGKTQFIIPVHLLPHINNPQHLVNIATQRQVIDKLVPHDPFLVNKKCCSISYRRTCKREFSLLV